MNGNVFTISEMYISDTGELIAKAKEGGIINLYNVKKIEN